MMKDGRPYTNENGWEDSKLITDEPEFTQKIVFAWIHANIIPAKAPNNRRTSYGIKHILERDTGIYLTNNQFKDAMFLAGFAPAKAKELNWTYRIKETSPAFKYDNHGVTPCVHHGLSCADFYDEIRRKHVEEWERAKQGKEPPPRKPNGEVSVTLTVGQWETVMSALEERTATERRRLSRETIDFGFAPKEDELLNARELILTAESALKAMKIQMGNCQ